MTKTLTIFIALLSLQFGYSQTTSDFENFGLAPEQFLDGSDGSGGFSSGNIRLLNSFNDNYSSWSGWAISSTTDTLTPGFTNQYSCIAGAGVDNSSSYATAFVSGESLLHTEGMGQGVVEGFYINNSTYAFLSMRDGDAFAKKFGGEDGTDPDFYYVSIKEHGSRNVVNDSIIFYLADFRFPDSADDYIVDEWTWIDLQRFENVDTLAFTIHSSDVGAFGVNTPAYFCVDDIRTTDMALTSTNETLIPEAKLYPNPTHGDIWVENLNTQNNYQIIDVMGRVQAAGIVSNSTNRINLEGLTSGTYFIKLDDENGRIRSQQVIIE